VSSPAPYLGLRALIFAGVTATLAAGAHVAAGGALPPTAPLAAGVLLTALAARTAGRRERRLPAVLVSVAVTQLGFHVAFLGAHQHAHPAGGLRMVATRSPPPPWRAGSGAGRHGSGPHRGGSPIWSQPAWPEWVCG